jgi:hypothetical protein
MRKSLRVLKQRRFSWENQQLQDEKAQQKKLTFFNFGRAVNKHQHIGGTTEGQTTATTPAIAHNDQQEPTNPYHRTRAQRAADAERTTPRHSKQRKSMGYN